MTRTAFTLRMQVFEVICYEAGDGPGDAGPYLWPVFSKIDGETFAVDAVGLIGFPPVFATNGNHGNLGQDMDDFDQVIVPAAVGMKTTELKPIPVNDPNFIELIGDDLPGIAGLVVVLMEEDGWPDDIPTAAYKALVDALHLGVAKTAASFQKATSAPTKEQINEQIALIKDSVGKMVEGAVLQYMSGPQLAWYGTLGNNDDRIGTEAWTVNQDDFESGKVKTFERR